jgi:hypothetical protein
MAQMSDTYKKTEEQKRLDEQAAAQKKIAENTSVFWAKQSECRLANFVQEKKDGNGNIIRPEVSLEFHEHIVTTDDEKKKEFIRGHSAFEQGDVCEVADIAEAQMKTRALEAIKYGNREVNIESKESTRIKD